MNLPESIVFEHNDLKDIFKKILSQSSTLQSFEEHEIGSAAYCRVYNTLVNSFVYDVVSQMSDSMVLHYSSLPRVIFSNDWSKKHGLLPCSIAT